MTYQIKRLDNDFIREAYEKKQETCKSNTFMARLKKNLVNDFIHEAKKTTDMQTLS